MATYYSEEKKHFRNWKNKDAKRPTMGQPRLYILELLYIESNLFSKVIFTKLSKEFAVGKAHKPVV